MMTIMVMREQTSLTTQQTGKEQSKASKKDLEFLKRKMITCTLTDADDHHHHNHDHLRLEVDEE